jgi:hypothetical protein
MLAGPRQGSWRVEYLGLWRPEHSQFPLLVVKYNLFVFAIPWGARRLQTDLE